MAVAPISLVGKSIEWTGFHHSPSGDFTELSTHTVTYVSEGRCYVTANGKHVGDAHYVYRRMDDRMGIVIYRPEVYQGRRDVTLHAMFDFAEGTDRAVILAAGEPFAVANGRMRDVPTPTFAG